MKFGIRTPSLKRRFAARTSVKRMVRHNLGFKVPRGLGIFSNPKKAIYNKVYNKTSMSVDRLLSTGNIKSNEIAINSKNGNNSFLINIVIFIALCVIYFPLAIVFIAYKVYKSRKTKALESNVGRNDSTPCLATSIDSVGQISIRKR